MSGDLVMRLRTRHANEYQTADLNALEAADRIEELEKENDRLRKDQPSLKAAAKKALKNATEMDHWHRYGEGYEVLIKLVEGIANEETND